MRFALWRFQKRKLLETAALAEGYSNHPIAVSIKEACKCKDNLSQVKNTKDIGGTGIIAETDDGDIILGNKKIMDANGIEVIENNGVGTVVYIARNNVYLGSILISDTVKSGVKEAIRNIKNMGVKSCVMLPCNRPAIPTVLSVPASHESGRNRGCTVSSEALPVPLKSSGRTQAAARSLRTRPPH